jgi:arylsulfatase
LPNQNGFDDYLGLPYSNDMIPPKWQPIALLDNRDTAALDPDQTLLTKMYTQRAMKFITSHKEEPFFIYVPYAMPHVPLHPGKEFAGKSERGLYGDVIEEIDWSVGEIMKTLKKEGLAEHTLVVFTSDNGPWIIKDVLGGSAGLLRDGKGSTWEGGMREPMIAWWPGTVQAGSIQMQPCGTIDLFPTLLSLANATATPIQPINGVDISKVITENETLRERPLFYYKGNELHGVRKGSWKLLVKTYSQTGQDYFEGKLPLLFNLDTDPSEKYDLSDDNPDIVRALTMELKEHQRKQELHPDLHTLTPLN